MGLLCAISIVLVHFIHIPIIPAAPFLEYDPADVPILLSAYLFGPLAGLGVTFVASVIQGVTVSASSGPIGIFMHFVATGAMAVTVGLISKHGTFGVRTAVAMVCGALAMVMVMIPLNIIVTPIFMNVPRADVIKMLAPAIIPFNVVKAGFNSAAAFMVYAALYKFLPYRQTKSI